MDLRKIFKIAVVTHWFIIIVSIPASKYLSAYLPEQLQEYKLWVNEQGNTNLEFTLVLLVAIVCLGHTISCIGLFFFKSWAKSIYIAATVSMMILSSFLGPTVEHALTNPIGSISSIASGFILYMLFFTNVIPKKGREKNSL